MKPSYEELEQKLAESQREFRAADATIENLQMQVEKLAAELNEIKAAVIARMKLHEEIRNAGRPPHTDFWHQSIYMADKMVDDSLASTPNHDAFLAEVRASALPVEIAEIIDSGDLEAILFASGYSEAERYRMALYNFRTSRKGVRS